MVVAAAANTCFFSLADSVSLVPATSLRFCAKVGGAKVASFPVGASFFPGESFGFSGSESFRLSLLLHRHYGGEGADGLLAVVAAHRSPVAAVLVPGSGLRDLFSFLAAAAGPERRRASPVPVRAEPGTLCSVRRSSVVDGDEAPQVPIL